VRSRLIRASWWTDGDLHLRLTAEQREFWIGLWMLADDEGYLEWDPARVGAELYPYKSVGWRRRLPDWLATLGPGHARLLECGRHVFIPNLARYQTVPRPTTNVHRRHLSECTAKPVPAPARTGEQIPARARTGKAVPKVRVEKGKEGKGGSASPTIAGAPAPAREASDGPPRGLRATAEAVLADPNATAEAKAGAQAMLDLRRDR
jgi:hypothetical protein